MAITFDVYQSLLRVTNIHNINSYVYRIANNVYARFREEEKKANQGHFLERIVPDKPSSNRDETYTKIRKEISYLGKMQREVIILYYFDKLKQKEIAKRLKISLEMVKWYLLDAKNQIKEGFISHHDELLEYQHIRFTNLVSNGSTGPLNTVMSFYFNKGITQVITYSAYHQAKTAKEIARELSIPLVFVEDEIAHLVENGFMNKLPNHKFITNILLMEANPEKDKITNKLCEKFLEMVCDLYIPLLFEVMKPFMNPTLSQNTVGPQQKIFYIPQHDNNFFMWSIITYACYKKLVIQDATKEKSKYYVQRKDGGSNIAVAKVVFNSQKLSPPKKINQDQTAWTNIKVPKNNFEHVDVTTRSSLYHIDSWQYFSQFDDRHDIDIETSLLAEFIHGNIPKTPANAEKFMRLYDKGYIVSQTPKISSPEDRSLANETVNLVITNFSPDELISILPPIPKKIKTLYQQLSDEIYRINQKYFPTHIHEVLRIMTKNSLSGGKSRENILFHLIKNGVLTPIKDHQKKTVNMIIFSDTLPQSLSQEKKTKER